MAFDNYQAKKYTEKAIDFITRNQNAPFYLHLCHAMPHKPLAASERFYTPETPNDLYADVMKELDWSVGEVMNTLKEKRAFVDAVAQRLLWDPVVDQQEMKTLSEQHGIPIA